LEAIVHLLPVLLGFLPLWLFVQATTCGVKACLLLVAVFVAGCCCVLVLELTWIVTRILAPLPCKISPALWLWWIVSTLSHVCPLVQLSLSCARSAVLFSSGNCLRAQGLDPEHRLCCALLPCTLWILLISKLLYS
jgi:hypothetical protein